MWSRLQYQSSGGTGVAGVSCDRFAIDLEVEEPWGVGRHDVLAHFDDRPRDEVERVEHRRVEAADVEGAVEDARPGGAHRQGLFVDRAEPVVRIDLASASSFVMRWNASASSLASVAEALRVLFDMVALPIESVGVIGMTLLFREFVVRRSVSPTLNVALVLVPLWSWLSSTPFSTSKPRLLPQFRFTSTRGVNLSSCSMVSMAVMIALG